MILLTQAIRESEETTLRQEPIASLDLMERAGAACAQYLLSHLEIRDYDKIMVFCGPGNNGGDGLVVARLLAQQGLLVETVLCKGKSRISHEFSENLEHLNRLPLTNLSIVDYDPVLFQTNAPVLAIDALFGIGLSKPLKGYFADIVNHINNMTGMRVSIDVPSGLFIDLHTPPSDPVVQAGLTLTFQFQKLAYVMAENAHRVGQVEILDIGLLKPEVLSDQMIPLIEKPLARKIRRPSPPFAHKGMFGHGLLVAGSRNMPGAALLAAGAALRAGAGKLTAHLPASVATSFPSSLPEVMLSWDAHADFFTGVDWEKLPPVDAVAIGPGLGRHPKTEAALGTLLDEISQPVVLDADALNILSEHKTWLAFLPAGSILTPHVKEFERLAGKADHDFDRLDKLKAFARRYGVVVILKGRYSPVAMPDGNLFFNTTGNPGMATGGSGDLLTGILLGLLARGYPPEEAALLGVFLHGLAGDLALEEEQSPESLTPSDIIQALGKAYRSLSSI